MRGRDDLHTEFALRALDFASAFKTVLGQQRVGDYFPELTAPDGPSTGGGVQSVQHIRLVPTPEFPNQPVVVVGSANGKTNSAELRSFDHIDTVYRRRFKRPIDLERGDYDRFLGRARTFFTTLNFSVETAAAPAPEPASPRVPRTVEVSRSAVALVLLGAVLLGALVTVAVWRLLSNG